jgi:hypothetical protein
MWVLVRPVQAALFMREMIIISAEELDELKAEADRLRAEVRELFTQAEVNAIREQQEARLRAVERVREEIEWQVRLELARVIQAEEGARLLAADMRRLLTTLKALLAPLDQALAPVVVPPMRRVA